MAKEERRSLSLRIQLSISISIIVIIITSLIGYYTINHMQKSLRVEYLQRILAQTRAIANSSAGSILLPPGESSMILYPMVLDYLEGNPDCLDITIVDKDGKIRGAEDVSELKSEFDKPEYKALEEDILLNEDEKLGKIGDDFLTIVPIRKANNIYGQVWAKYSSERLIETIITVRNNVILLGSIIIFIGVILSILIANKLVSPINRLLQATLRIGEGDLSYRVEGIKARNEVGILAENFNEMAKKLEEAQQIEIDKNIMEREFKLAEELQSSLLPEEFPSKDSIDIYAICKTARTVGGDYYDIIQLDDQNLAIIVADISGKGLSGLLVMSLIRNIMRIQARKHFKPKRVLMEANTQITPDFQKGRFVTVFYGLYNYPTRTLSFASAGHTPLIHFTNNDEKLTTIDSKGRPLGIFVGDYFNNRLEERSIVLSPDDFIVVFTDGLTESVNEEDEFFGEERLYKLVETISSENSSRRIVNEIFSEVMKFSGEDILTDDITILTLKSS